MIPREELSRILARYDLGEVLDARPAAQGSIQTNLILKTSGGKRVLRIYRNRRRESVLFEVNLIRFLKRKGFPCAGPVRTARGRFVGRTDGKPFVLFEFVEGVHLKRPSRVQRKHFIGLVADLHRVTWRYRPRRLKHRWNYGVPFCKRRARAKAAEVGTADAAAKCRWIEAELRKLSIPASAPKCVCHGDFHYGNVLFRKNRCAALLDFDDANCTYPAYDVVGIAEPFVRGLNWDTWRDYEVGESVFDFARLRAVLSEYGKHRPLLPVEQKYLFDVVKLSILIDTLWYFRRGDSKAFFERRKIECLNHLGRARFRSAVFG
jgi:Ser/Thr protein kinase RdoA (MazF antagonist)